MQITEIVVSAGRTFNNPYESYSNLRPEVTLKATLAEGDDPHESAKELQAQAERLVEKHKTQLLVDLDRLHTREIRTRDIARLEEQIGKATTHLADLKAEESQEGNQRALVLQERE